MLFNHARAVASLSACFNSEMEWEFEDEGPYEASLTLASGTTVVVNQESGTVVTFWGECSEPGAAILIRASSGDGNTGASGDAICDPFLSWSGSADVANLPDGSFFISAEYDGISFSGATAAIEGLKDVEAPSIALVSPAAGDTFPNTHSTLTLSGSCSTDVTSFLLESTDIPCTEGSWSAVISWSSRSVGMVSLAYSATDSLGNIGTASFDLQMTDAIAPVLTGFSINDSASTASSLSLALTYYIDGDASMVYVSQSACDSGGEWAALTGSPMSYSASAGLTSSGSTTLYMKVRDSAANESNCLSDSIAYPVPQFTESLISMATRGTHTLTLTGGIAPLLVSVISNDSISGGGQVTAQADGSYEFAAPRAPGYSVVGVTDAVGNSAMTTVRYYRRPLLAAGQTHVCMVTSAGVRCWGDNGQAQLGPTAPLGESFNSEPSTAFLSGMRAISAGSGSTCALSSSGTVQCWGNGPNGELGDGSTGVTSTPVTVSGISNAVTVSVAGNTACALTSDGTVNCWGSGANGQLGNGVYGSSTIPILVSGLTDAVDVDVGSSHV